MERRSSRHETQVPNRRSVKTVALLLAWCLAVTACGGATTTNEAEPATGGVEPLTSEAKPAATATPSTLATSAPATAPPATAVPATSAPVPTPTPGPELSAAYLAEIANKVTPWPGAYMVVFIDEAGEVVVGINGIDPDGASPAVSDVFRVASITKIFTALVALTLVDEGLVDLDAPAADYVTRVPIDDEVTVRHLLQHRSGIANYTDVPGLLATIATDQERLWTPEESVDLIADQALEFRPGAAFSYSNTNYAILGILIEEVTTQPYHQVLRERIIDPLGLEATYLAGYEEGAVPFDPFELKTGEPYNYTSIATQAWSAGALVSNAADLHTFFVAVFDEQVVSQAMLNELTTGAEYGLGIELVAWQQGIVGHGGAIPGYLTHVWHSPKSGTTAFHVTTHGGVNLFAPSRRIGELLIARNDEHGS